MAAGEQVRLQSSTSCALRMKPSKRCVVRAKAAGAVPAGAGWKCRRRRRPSARPPSSGTRSATTSARKGARRNCIRSSATARAGQRRSGRMAGRSANQRGGPACEAGGDPGMNQRVAPYLFFTKAVRRCVEVIMRRGCGGETRRPSSSRALELLPVATVRVDHERLARGGQQEVAVGPN